MMATGLGSFARSRLGAHVRSPLGVKVRSTAIVVGPGVIGMAWQDEASHGYHPFPGLLIEDTTRFLQDVNEVNDIGGRKPVIPKPFVFDVEGGELFPPDPPIGIGPLDDPHVRSAFDSLFMLRDLPRAQQFQLFLAHFQNRVAQVSLTSANKMDVIEKVLLLVDDSGSMSINTVPGVLDLNRWIQDHRGQPIFTDPDGPILSPDLPTQSIQLFGSERWADEFRVRLLDF